MLGKIVCCGTGTRGEPSGDFHQKTRNLADSFRTSFHPRAFVTHKYVSVQRLSHMLFNVISKTAKMHFRCEYRYKY